MRPELIRAAELLQRNNGEAAEEAIALLQNTVYSFSMKVCGHTEDAEDTMQEVLFRSLPYLAKIQDPQALSVWLYTVTRNRCWRMRRKPAQAPSRNLSLDELMPDDAELGRLLADKSNNPEGNAIQAEQQRLLQQAVLRIPAPLRIVLVLHDMEELSTDEVAKVLNLQTGTVRVRLHRARLAVRKQVALMAERARKKTSRRAKASPKKRPLASKRPAACRELFANLSEYLDNRVDPQTCEQIRSHMEGCPACVAFLRDLRNAIDRCHALDVQCDPAVARRLRSLLTAEYLRMLDAVTPKESRPAL